MRKVATFQEQFWPFTLLSRSKGGFGPFDDTTAARGDGRPPEVDALLEFNTIAASPEIVRSRNGQLITCEPFDRAGFHMDDLLGVLE